MRSVRSALGFRARAAVAATVLGLLSCAGCGANPEPATNSVDNAVASTSDSSAFQLPPDFQVVAIPLEQRKEVFKEAHDIRALAVQRANRELPMDEAHLPKNDRPAFDKRVAEHKAIINRIAAKDLAALAEKHKLQVADIEKIEEEASRLRWVPPPDPVLETKGPAAESKAEAQDDSKAEKGESPKPKPSESK